MKTFDIVDAMVQAHTEELGDEMVLNEKSVEILRSYCDVIDTFIEDNDGRGVEADIVGNNLIAVSAEMFGFIYEKKFKSPLYLELIKRSIKVSFKNVDGDYIKATFVFPRVWNKK